MGRVIVAVIAGYAVWTALWLGGNAVLFAEAAAVIGDGEAYTAAGPLAGVIVLSVACSLAAGLTAAAMARVKARGAVLSMAALLLLTGIGVQAGVWSFMPVWYHLIFLALIVPVAVLGGRFAGPRSGVAGA